MLKSRKSLRWRIKKVCLTRRWSLNSKKIKIVLTYSRNWTIKTLKIIFIQTIKKIKKLWSMKKITKKSDKINQNMSQNNIKNTLMMTTKMEIIKFNKSIYKKDIVQIIILNIKWQVLSTWSINKSIKFNNWLDFAKIGLYFLTKLVDGSYNY
jgi:hypothetical protein